MPGNEAVSAKRQDNLTAAMQKEFKNNNVELYNATSVSPSIAGSFFAKSLVAVLITALLVVVYIGFRFRNIGGVYEIVPIREDAIETFCRSWGAGHIGRMTDDLGECRNTKGYHNIRVWYGSSDYDTKQMSRLIDLIVQECKAVNIETLQAIAEALGMTVDIIDPDLQDLAPLKRLT